MTSHQTADPLIGRLVDGRYRVRARIARGGMATVYVATDLRLERRIALKVMHSHLSDDTVFQSKFIQEARAAARLADPNVVNVFDQGQDGELAYLVMEYLPGITLRELLKDQRRLGIAQTITVMDAILSGLAAAHRAGIVHRDVKPENVLLAEDGRIKIGDFGLARATTANTATGGQLLGTIAYLAPELVTRGTADARSDIYSLGIMLYEMLAGEQPYRGEQPMQIAFQHATESVPRPSVRNPSVPEQLDELVLWSTEREPADRPADAQVMLDRLREIEAELGVSPVVTRHEVPVTAGLSIPEDASTSGITTVLPLEAASPVVRVEPADTTDNATRLRKVTTRGHSRGRLLLIMTIVLALFAGGLGWFFGSGPGSLITVPDLAGQSEEAANAALAERGLIPEHREIASLEFPAGEVVKTDPASGMRVEAESTVGVFVSTGPAPADLATFVGLSADEAATVLAGQQITVSDQPGVFSEDVVGGLTYSVVVSPAAGGDDVDCTTGCSVHQGDTAVLAVSRGSVPAVKGLPSSQARAKLGDAKLVVTDSATEVFTSEQPADAVVRVDGPQDRDWREGDTVTLVVSKGAVPDVSGKSESDARKTLSDAGLTVADDLKHEFSDTVGADRIIAVQGADGEVAADAVITLVISDGPQLFEVPDVSGKTLREAMDELRGRGFTPTTAMPEGVLWDFFRVSGTDPAAHSMHPAGTKIRVTSVG